ncbi:hypothetical protein DMX04_21055 [Pseudomonas koreensis]|jgi:hypothetical protein|nr:hypothetical protein DMX04_21055 [Pseudomonas koreensis]
MLKIVLTCIAFFCGTYFIGEKIRRNPKIDAFLGVLEGSYTRINQHLENSSVRSGLMILRKFYGWITLILFGALFFIMYVFPGSTGIFLGVSQLFFLTFMGWFSIKWAIDHKATLTEHWKTHSLMIFGPLLMGVMDTFVGTPFTQALSQPLEHLPGALHVSVIGLPPLAVGALYSGFCLVVFLLYYLMTWIITTPVLIASVLVIALPIHFARLLTAIDRENTFLWFAICVAGVCAIWLTQL